MSAARRAPEWDIAGLFLATRLALLLAGLLSALLLAPGTTVQRGNLVYHSPAPLPLEIWARWDSEWYLLIAQEGYGASALVTSLPANYEPEATAGFLPLYPLLIRIVGAAVPPLRGVAAGVLLSNLCLLASLLLLFRLASEAAGAGRGRAAGTAACAAMLVYPMSFFLSAVYSESLFLILTLAFFHLCRRGRFGAASAAGALAALTRPLGIALAVPFMVEWWQQRREAGAGSRPRALSVLWVILIPGSFVLFMVHCYRVFGDATAFFARQERWRGASSGPWRALVRWWEAGPAIHGAHDSTTELVIAVAFLAGLPVVFRKLRASYAVYAAIAVLLPLCSTLWSFGRMALMAFPVFMVIGLSWAEGRSRPAVLYAAVGATLSGFFMALFASWWWAG
jgi:hypothetical protein